MTTPALASIPPPKKKLTGTPRKVEVAGQVTAGSIGSVYGAVKLRDEFLKDPRVKPEHKALFRRTVMRGKQKAVALGVKPATATRVARAVRAGHPGFRPLAVLVGGGAVATAAHRSQQVRAALDRRRAGATDWAGGKSAPAHDGGKPLRLAVQRELPRHAVRPYVGVRRVPTRVDKLKLHGNSFAMIHGPQVMTALREITDLTKSAGRIAPRDTLESYPLTKGSAMISAFGVEHYTLSKADDSGTVKDYGKPTGGRRLAAYAFPGGHGLVAGKKGKKLRAWGSEQGHTLGGMAGGSVAGGLAGAGLGALAHNPQAGALVGANLGMVGGGITGSQRAVNSNQAKGRYKAQDRS